MSIDERLEALTQTLELTEGMKQVNEREIGQLATLLALDGENLRALARIAVAHEHRPEDIHGHP